MVHWRPSEKKNWQRPGNSRVSVWPEERLELLLSLFAGRSTRFSSAGFSKEKGGGKPWCPLSGSCTVVICNVIGEVH